MIGNTMTVTVPVRASREAAGEGDYVIVRLPRRHPGSIYSRGRVLGPLTMGKCDCCRTDHNDLAHKKNRHSSPEFKAISSEPGPLPDIHFREAGGNLLRPAHGRLRCRRQTMGKGRSDIGYRYREASRCP